MISRAENNSLRGRWRCANVARGALVVAFLVAVASVTARADEPAPKFYRAINLNGPSLRIDGNAWEANADARDLVCDDEAFEKQDVPLSPPTDDARAQMIRSSRWRPDGQNRVVLTNVSAGDYSVLLYVWEDNDPQTYTVSLEGAEVAKGVNSGPGGSWQRLGPWHVNVTDGTIELTSAGGHANFSGIEVWTGRLTSASTIKSTPAAQPIAVKRRPTDWWSFQPVKRPDVPAVKDPSRVRTPTDNFILSALEERDLVPAPEAGRVTLIRRASFDLIGLPPTPEEVEAFVNDESPDAYEKLVDRLLASPHYGERWGRHWLDVVRFGESQGFERNRVRENAWRYRDWVIGAFNEDMPYDEFVRRQIAGDVLHPGDLGALVATGYHVIGTWDQVAHLEGSDAMRRVARQDALEDLVATLGQAFLGVSINCARCHDHKFDPITQREYYQIAALLGGVTQEEKERQNVKVAGYEGPLHVVIPKQPPVTYLLERGNINKPKDVVSPAALEAVSGPSPDLGLAPDAPEAERRAKLAAWMTDPANPLTPRVLVNRVWHHHFGQGIVGTPSDFGAQGGKPSHPELLDYLASRFVEGGWRIKDLHRLIMNSSAYRQQSQVRNDRAEAIDADNRLLWRMTRRRLEGEAVRDAALAVSGVLNRQLGGPSFRDVTIKDGANNNHEFHGPTGEFSSNTCRRTVYRLWGRAGGHPMLDSLDCPEPSVMSPRRTISITPVQALSLLNNSFMENCAKRFADRVRAEAGGEAVKQTERAYRLALARAATDEERTLAAPFIKEHGLEQFCLVLMNTSEFMFVE